MFFINLTTLRYTTVQPIEQTVHLFIKATFFTHVAIMVIQFLTFMHDTKLTSVLLQAIPPQVILNNNKNKLVDVLPGTVRLVFINNPCREELMQNRI